MRKEPRAPSGHGSPSSCPPGSWWEGAGGDAQQVVSIRVKKGAKPVSEELPGAPLLTSLDSGLGGPLLASSRPCWPPLAAPAAWAGTREGSDS